MEIIILDKNEGARYHNAILEMLFSSDGDFVPPLSARNSAMQTDLNSSEKIEGGIINYFEEIKKHEIMVATENEKVIAFVAFRKNFINEKISEEELPNIYISTLIVRPEGRGKGITQKMYAYLFKRYETVNFFTRTWSTNIAHIRILSKFNFEKICVIENDRGKGVDTVYFKKSFST